MDAMLDKIFFHKEERLNDLKDVFKRLVALDMYFDIKNNQNKKDEESIENVGSHNNILNTNDATMNKINSGLSEYLGKRSASYNKELEPKDYENSLFSHDMAFSESNSSASNTDIYSGREDETEDYDDGDCFIQYIINDLINLMKVKKIYNYFFDDPLVNYIMKKYEAHNEDLYKLYMKYYSYLDEHIEIDKDQIYDYLNRKLWWYYNKSIDQLSLVKVLKNEAKGLGKELNGLIINLYNSRVNLKEVYYLIEYYNLDIESLSVDVKAVQYGLRMDESIKDYFNNNEFMDKLLHQLNEYNENEVRISFGQFYSLVSTTTNVVNNNKIELRKNNGLSDSLYLGDDDRTQRKKIIRNLLFQNVFGLENDLNSNTLYKLEPIPF